MSITKTYILLILLAISFLSCEGQRVQPLLTPPPSGGGNPFSYSCVYPRISGFSLTAQCRASNGSYRNAATYFGNCIYNYDGNLSHYNGSTVELYTRYCRIYTRN